MSRTFALGLGAQKAGTSWLHDHLASSPECAAGFRKEFHVWDGLDLASEAWMRRRVMARAVKAAESLHAGGTAGPHALRQAGFYADPSSYFDYFDTLMRRQGAQLSLDITPSYALLGADRLRMIRDEFAARGITVVPVFLLRDPVERIWSMVRMNQQRRPEEFPGPTALWVERLHTRDDHALRTRYDVTLAALDDAFGDSFGDSIGAGSGGSPWVGFYEELFTAPVLADLCGRLGIAPVPADVDTVVNAAPKRDTLPESLVAAVAAHFADVYADVARRFGRARVLDLWPSAHLL